MVRGQAPVRFAPEPSAEHQFLADLGQVQGRRRRVGVDTPGSGPQCLLALRGGQAFKAYTCVPPQKPKRIPDPERTSTGVP